MPHYELVELCSRAAGEFEAFLRQDMRSLQEGYNNNLNSICQNPFAKKKKWGLAHHYALCPQSDLT